MDSKRASSGVPDNEPKAKQGKLASKNSSSTSAEERNCVVNMSVPDDHLSIQDLLCLKPHGYHSDVTNEFTITALHLGRFVNTITSDGDTMKMDLKPPKWPMRINLEEAKALWPALKCMIDSIENSQQKQLHMLPRDIVEDAKLRKKNDKCCECGSSCLGVDMIG